MKPTPKAPPSRLCYQCHEVVHAHKDSVFAVQDGERRLFHTACYPAFRKGLIKKLREEAKQQAGEQRKRLATPCLTCGLKRTRVFTGSFDGPHIRVCADGHYQLISERGRVAITEYA